MAFLIEALMEDWEVRGTTEGVSKAGKPWASVRVEDMSGRMSADVSTSDDNLIAAIRGLGKGDLVNLRVRAVAGKERSYLVLIARPEVLGNSYAPKAVDY